MIYNEKTYYFARLYGLKNIQNFIRSLKKSPCKYLYVEMMACPGGCLNGGGQIKDKDLRNKDLLEKLGIILHDLKEKTLKSSWDCKGIGLVEEFYKGKELDEVFGTEFKAIEKYEDLNW